MKLVFRQVTVIVGYPKYLQPSKFVVRSSPAYHLARKVINDVSQQNTASTFRAEFYPDDGNSILLRNISKYLP
jgi:hypothetical protein